MPGKDGSVHMGERVRVRVSVDACFCVYACEIFGSVCAYARANVWIRLWIYVLLSVRDCKWVNVCEWARVCEWASVCGCE